MTRKPVIPQKSLPVRSRGTGETEGNPQQARDVDYCIAQDTPQQSSEQLSGVPQYPMFPFGSEPSLQSNHELPPPMSPVMDFSASTPYYYDGPSQEDILSSFMSTEIAMADDIFEDYPSMIAEDFGMNRPVWLPGNSVTSRKLVRHFGRLD